MVFEKRPIYHGETETRRKSTAYQQFAEKVSCDVILNEVKDLKSLENKILRGVYPE